MKHLVTIQKEFLKTARNWDDLSLDEQKGYIKRHPKTKKKSQQDQQILLQIIK